MARLALACLMFPLVLVISVVGGAAAARAAGTVSAALLPGSGFPAWYADSAGNRVEPCLDPADPNCIAPTGAGFDPAAPLAFPTNFPDEFFYAIAESNLVTTPGCNGTAPGRASVRLALEGAFVNADGVPAPGDQMVFGRIRVKVTSGLCPNTTYQFRHPFGVERFTTNDAGAVPANVGTQDVGCVPTPGVPCDFRKANASRVMGTAAAGGFLRWDPAVAPAAPGGYLGDAVTAHRITGGTSGNDFAILDAAGNPVVDAGAPLATDLFVVAGKLAGSLLATPDPVDLGGQVLGSTSAATTVTVTNVDAATVTVPAGGVTLTGPDAASFAVPGASNACAGASLARDQSCTLGVTFSPLLPGRVSATVRVASTGGIRSPLSVVVTGRGVAVGAVPDVALAPTSLAFGDQRVRTTSGQRTLTVTNSGDAPLRVSSIVLTDGPSGSGASHYRLLHEDCTTGGRTVDPGATCAVQVVFAPMVAGAHPAQLQITSNANGSPHTVGITGTGTGGVAAVSPGVDPADGFPDWYRDEAGIKVAQCIDKDDPYCVVLPDATFDPAHPVSFPGNFPGEFFYQVADSDVLTTPGCQGGPTGKAFMRSALEAAFTTEDPVPGEQIVFGRIRIAVIGGLCPNTTYTFTHPYGVDRITTDDSGSIARNKGTEDVGCFPVAPDVCEFALPLSARVMGGFLRWDPAVAPAAPAGYLGDAATPHTVVGAPFSVDGAPANFFRLSGPDGVTIAQTDRFTVMGKLRGPLEATGGVNASGRADFGAQPVGTPSASHTLTFTNTGITPLDLTTIGVTGADAGDFTITGGSCGPGTPLVVGGTCTVAVSFAPAAVGNRSATLTLTHTGLNSPLAVPLTGIGGAAGGQAALSFAPRSLTFGPLHIGRTSAVETVQVSNTGGSLPLQVAAATVVGPDAAAFTVVDNRCTSPVAPDTSCQIDVAFTPQAAGTLTASLRLTDNAPGGQHDLTLTGTATTASKAVSATRDGNGFPRWYADQNGTRLEPCVDPADSNCIVLGDAGFDPAQPVAFPGNFPGEFFYTVADSQLITTPGCAGTAPGTAMLRVALEGSFAGGQPTPGDQTTFTRIRVVVTSGLCPNVDYRFLTPYGTFTFHTDANGGFKRAAATQDVGCAAAPCSFADALVSPGPAPSNSDTVVDGFLRWDPNTGPAAPAGYLGDAVTYHKVVGGTFVPAAGRAPVNEFAISDLAGNVVGRTDLFLVSGKVAGPLQADTAAVDFGHLPTGTTSGVRTVTLTNVAAAGLAVPGIALTGPDAGQFQLAPGGSCGAAALPLDGTCTVNVVFAPTSTGTKAATLRVTPSSGRVTTVSLTGKGDPAQAPAVTVTPGVLAFGTVTAGAPATLTTVVNNPGTGNLVITGTPISGTAAGDFAVPATTCGAALPYTVAPGGSCTVSVRFTPKATGARTALLTLQHNATGGSTAVSLSGSAVASAITVSPNPVGLGKVNRNTTKTQTVTVRNSGGVTMRVTGVSITGGPTFSVAGGTCLGRTVAPGKSCSITVSFRPTAATAYTANLTVTGDTTTLPGSVTVRVTGTGK